MQEPARLYSRCLTQPSQLKTGLAFWHSSNRERENGGQFPDLSPLTTRIDSETLFNGAMSAASVDHVQNSHACPPRRYYAAVDWTARATLHAPSTRRVRAVQLFARAEISACLQQHSINTRARLPGSREAGIHWLIEKEFSREEE
jgi:hypothetical protein